MKSLTFNANSWHYKLARITLNAWDLENIDICRYTRRVMGGALLLLLTACAIAAAGFVLFHVVFGIVFGMIYGWWILTDMAWVGLILLFMAVGTICFIIGTHKFVEWKDNRPYKAREPARPDNFVKQAYRSWKEKFCVKITFTDSDV